MAARLFQIFSLRFKLMIVAVVAAMILIGLLVGNSIRLIDDTLVEGMNARVKIVAPLLGESLKGPLARADFAVA